jgi:formate hydrogenlyase subunit 3/multisubunit Na+/H+ antiporter MnhD subunit
MTMFLYILAAIYLIVAAVVGWFAFNVVRYKPKSGEVKPLTPLSCAFVLAMSFGWPFIVFYIIFYGKKSR